MSRKSTRSRGRSRFEFSSFVKAVGLIALTLVVAFLCVLALRHGQGSQSSQPTVTGEAQTPAAPTSAAGATPTPAATTQPVSGTAVPATQIITAVDESSAYRAAVGSCPAGGSAIETTRDGGATWTSFDASGQLGVGDIRAIGSSGNGYAFFTGLDLADCTSMVAGHSYSSGAEWSVASTIPDTVWSIDPANTQSLSGPGGLTVDAPCSLVQVVAGGENAVAGICADGTVTRSADSGSTWTQSDPVQGIDALAFSGDNLVAGSVGDASCEEGVAIRVMDSSLGVTKQSCAPAGAAPAGQTALSHASDGTLWLLAGDSVLRSSDNGESWG